MLELLDPDSFLIRNRSDDGDGEADFERTFSLLEEVPAGKIVCQPGRHPRTATRWSRWSAPASTPRSSAPGWSASGLADACRVLRGDAR